MTHQLSQYRLTHGETHLTVLPDGTEIPWRPLTIGEFMEYDDLMKSGQYSIPVIEDEIFKKCVTDRFYLVNIDKLSAGIVSTVVTNIMAYSGPQTIDDFNEALSTARAVIQGPLHTVVDMVCRAFPAYKPEDVYSMDYSTLMLRTAMAEQRLLLVKFITEPLHLRPPASSGAPPQPAPEPQKTEPQKLEKLKSKLADLTQRANTVPQVEKKTVITAADEGQFIPSSGHEMMDYEVEKFKYEKEKVRALDGIEHIYGDYLKKMADGQKLTPDDFIKSNAEKKAEYYQRLDDIKTGKLNPNPPQEPPGPVKSKKIKRR